MRYFRGLVSLILVFVMMGNIVFAVAMDDKIEIKNKLETIDMTSEKESLIDDGLVEDVNLVEDEKEIKAQPVELDEGINTRPENLEAGLESDTMDKHEKVDGFEEETLLEMAIESDSIKNYEELKMEIEKFNKGREDKIIKVEGEIIFSDEDLGEGENIDSFLEITNLENHLTIEGVNNARFQVGDFSPKGDYRFIRIGRLEDILKDSFNEEGKVVIKNIDFDGGERLGAIGNLGGNLELENTNFMNHYIKNPILVGGAAILNSSKLTIKSQENMIFENNQNEIKGDNYSSNGGAIYNTSGLADYYILKEALGDDKVKKDRNFKNPKMDIKIGGKLTFKANRADRGGGIYNDSIINIDVEDDIDFINNYSMNDKDEDFTGASIHNAMLIDKDGEARHKGWTNELNITTASNIYFKENKSYGGEIFNGFFEKKVNKEIKLNEDMSMNMKLVAGGDVCFIGSDDWEDPLFMEYGGVILNKSSLGLDSQGDVKSMQSNLVVEAGGDLIFKDYSNREQPIVHNGVNNTFESGYLSGKVSYMNDLVAAIKERNSVEDYNLRLGASGNIGFINNKQNKVLEYQGIVFNESLYGIRIHAGKNIDFRENQINGGSTGIVKNEITGYSKSPVRLDIESETGSVNFTENKIGENDGGGIVKNAGQLSIKAHEDIRFKGNTNIGEGLINAVAIYNLELLDNYSGVTEEPIYKVDLLSEEGDIIFEGNFGGSDSTLIANSGFLDILAKNNISIKNNSVKDSIILSKAAQPLIPHLKFFTKSGKVEINSNTIEAGKESESISSIFKTEETGFGNVEINSNGDLMILDNKNQNGGLIRINNKDKKYIFNMEVREGDFKNIDFNSVNGKIYIVGNEFSNQEPQISTQLSRIFEFDDPDKAEGLKEKLKGEFGRNRFKNIYLAGGSIFDNDFDSYNGEANELNNDNFPFKKVIIMLNGEDGATLLENKNSYAITMDKDKKVDEFRTIKMKINDTLIIRADDKDDKKAVLTGAEVFEEKIIFRDAIADGSIKALNTLKTTGARKDGYYIKHWKLGSASKEENPKKDSLTLTNEELIKKIIEPTNTLVNNLSKANDMESFLSTFIEGIKSSDSDIIKNLSKYEGGLVISPVWEKEGTQSKVRVNFDANGGKYQDGSIVKSKTIDKGTRVERIDDSPRRSGYSFRGWKKLGASRNFDFDTLIDEDITLYADWTKDSGGGRDKPDPKPEPNPEPKPDPKPQPDRDRRGREIGKIIEPKIEFDLNTVDHLAYIKGYEDSTVRPDGNLTREEAAMVFYRLMDKDFREIVKTKSHSFTDVEAGKWSERAIATLSNAEMISGYKDKSFKPAQPITRAELSSMIAKLTDTIVLHTEFQDIAEHWAEDYINTAKNKGWIKGYEDGSFRPDKYISRSEFATVLNSILDRKTNREDMLDGRKSFKDLEAETWYYEMMMEAINGHKYHRQDGREIWTELDDREFE